MSAFRGAALLFAAGGPISGFDPTSSGGARQDGPVPIPVIIFIAFAVLAHIVLRYTRYGRQVYAVGDNPEAARLSGLDVRAVICSVYVIMGFFAGLGAFVLSARLNSAEAVAGTGYELTVIASVVIGGTSLFGGVGTIFGTVVGTILIGVLLNGLVLMNVSPYIQQIIIGVIIVLAVAFDTFAKSRRNSHDRGVVVTGRWVDEEEKGLRLQFTKQRRMNAPALASACRPGSRCAFQTGKA